MKSIAITLLCWIVVGNSLAQSPGGSLFIQSQFINPCGLDGSNEFIVLTTGGSPVNIADIAFASQDHTSGTQPNFNFFWHGSNVPNEPNPTFTSNADVCGTAALECYGFAYPSNPTDATTINTRITELNTIAGCAVFLPVPNTDEIPANSDFIVFLGAYNCGFSNAATNMNFSNHCSGGTPLRTYYAVFGLGDGGIASCGDNLSGYFSNSNPRTSATFVYNGGDNMMASNYTQLSIPYTPGTAPASGNAGWINPAGDWINNQDCIGAAGALPVELSDFYGSAYQGRIVLNWITQTEKDNDYFSIERSADGKNFKEIAQVKGAGTSLSPQFYEFTDTAPFEGINHYRLRQVDTRGQFELHKQIAIQHLFKNPVQLSAYPIPAREQLSVALAENSTEKVDLLITDEFGRVLMRKTINSGAMEMTIDVSQLPPGHYALSAIGLRGMTSIRFLKL